MNKENVPNIIIKSRLMTAEYPSIATYSYNVDQVVHPRYFIVAYIVIPFNYSQEQVAIIGICASSL